MSLKNKLKQKGFTLVELMVALSYVNALLFIFLIGIFITNLTHYTLTLNTNRLNQQMEEIMQIMASDIRRAGYWANAAANVGTNTNTNPFQSTANGTDIAVGGAGNSCITFTYDRNSNGSLAGISSTSDDERYGFQLIGNNIQTRPWGATFACGATTWETMNDASIQVTALSFTINSSTVTTGPGAQGITERSVDISLTAQLASNPSISKTMTQHVRISNDYFVPKKNKLLRATKVSLARQQGITVLVLTVVLLLAATVIVVFAAKFSLTQSRITSNQYRNAQAFEAAQAGLEFGMAYLNSSATTILANHSGGHLVPYSDANTTNVALSNGAKYSIVYTNPVANNYQLILVTATGTSDDATSTRVVQQEVQYGSSLLAPGTYSLVSTGRIALSGSTTVTNTQTNNTIEAGSSVTGSGSFKTVTSSGTTSTSGNFGSDITQNVSSLANTSSGDLFSDYFGMTEAQYIAKAGHSYSNNSNYATTLNGMTNTTVYINAGTGSANFSGSATIGSASAPVLIVIDGNLNISGSLILYGFIFVNGASTATTNLSGSINITGGMATTNNISASGSINMTYDNAVLGNVQNSNAYYARVPGFWKDF